MEYGLYVHIPFCVKKCDYCDFASFSAGKDRMEAYTRDLLREIGIRQKLAESKVFSTVYFGGGTPSLLPVEFTGRIMCALKQSFTIREDAEITLEANPGTVTEPHLKALHDMGFNRISIGLQTAQDHLLHMLGRIHDLKAYREAIEDARAAGFRRISTDVMACLPNQTREDLMETLEFAIEAGSEHISMYSLQMEEGTPLAEKIGRGELTLPEDDEAAAILEEARHMLESRGFVRYEVSNFARPGAESEHNLLYWQYQNWLGLGCAAASQWEHARWNAPDTLSEYGDWVRSGAQPEREVLTREAEAFETLMMGLRLTRGVDRKTYEAEFGKDPATAWPSWSDPLYTHGLMKAGSSIALTETGMERMNGILVSLMEAMEEFD